MQLLRLSVKVVRLSVKLLGLWGKIVDVLMDTKCLNPIFFFDEVDKHSMIFRLEENS